MLQSAEVKISMDGKGRAIDNVCIERFWRTIKYDEVYLKDYVNMKEAKREIGNFIRKYNEERPHESLGGLTPIMLYDKVKQSQDEQESKPDYPPKKDSVAV